MLDYLTNHLKNRIGRPGPAPQLSAMNPFYKTHARGSGWMHWYVVFLHMPSCFALSRTKMRSPIAVNCIVGTRQNMGHKMPDDVDWIL